MQPEEWNNNNEGNMKAETDNITCTRCKNVKPISEFLCGDKQRRTCVACRTYGKVYIQKRSSINTKVESIHMNDSPMILPEQYDSREEESVRKTSYEMNDILFQDWVKENKEKIDNSLKKMDIFIDNLQWLLIHVEKNRISKPLYVAAIGRAIGKWLETTRARVEEEEQRIAGSS